MPKKILVIDDEADIQEVVRLTLELEGYEVDTANNGFEALQLLERGLPHLILVDMKMPVMDGWEFAREFRKRYDNRVPFIVVSATGDMRQRAEETGAVARISKPFDLERLVEIVALHL